MKRQLKNRPSQISLLPHRHCVLPQSRGQAARLLQFLSWWLVLDLDSNDLFLGRLAGVNTSLSLVNVHRVCCEDSLNRIAE